MFYLRSRLRFSATRPAQEQAGNKNDEENRMNVHVVACAIQGRGTIEVAILGVFTDANLELAKSYTELLQNYDERPCYLDTIEIDDPESIECLKEEIRDQGELADQDEAGPEIPVDSSRPESQGTTV
jgi:hypothetical protein